MHANSQSNPPGTSGIRRLIVLGASNLTRGFSSVVATARAAWGPEVEVLAALGHGRSYGVSSCVVCRTLPSILDAGLWRDLESRPALPTRGLVTDVGNDILYGYPPRQILDWVAESLARLRRHTSDIVVTDLPLVSVRRLTSAKFLLLRGILFPPCRLSLTQTLDRAEQVSAGLATLAVDHGARFVQPDPTWFGFDPIHVRGSAQGPAWRRMLACPETTPPVGGSRFEALRLALLRPERRWLFGVERRCPQRGDAMPRGGRVWLY